MNSVREPLTFLLENVSTEAGLVDETFVRMEAMREVDVAAGEALP